MAKGSGTDPRRQPVRRSWLHQIEEGEVVDRSPPLQVRKQQSKADDYPLSCLSYLSRTQYLSRDWPLYFGCSGASDADHIYSLPQERVFPMEDYAVGSKQKVMAVSADEFLRRYLIHVLPKALVRIRHFGLLANRKRSASLLRCRFLLYAAARRSQRPQLRSSVRLR